MEVTEATRELSEAELQAAQLGFRQLLRRKNFPEEFVRNYSQDLLGKAQQEYWKRIAEGGKVHNPAGWLIKCAYRRTQNLLEAEGHWPRMVGLDSVGALPDHSAPTPEEQVLEADRARRVQEAVDTLPLEQRKVIELCYFEGMSVREVGRALNWGKSKADRRHHAALERLRALLGVTDLDSLAIEIGLAAWISLATERGGAFNLPSGIDAMSDTASRGVADLIGRLHELARRFLVSGGGEPTAAAAASGAARTAGVCAAATVACLATGVVGPGVGGADLVGARHTKPPTHQPTKALAPAPGLRAPDATFGAPVANQPAISAGKLGRTASAARKRSRTASASSSTAAEQRTQREFDPFATGEGSATTADGSTASSATASSTSSSSPPSAARKQPSREFGL